MPCVSSFGVLYCDTFADLYSSVSGFASTAIVKAGSVLHWEKVPLSVNSVIVRPPILPQTRKRYDTLQSMSHVVYFTHKCFSITLHLSLG